MAYKHGNRDQQLLFPVSIEEYVGKEDVVRGFDAMIEALDVALIGLKIEKKKVGSPAYDPKSMLKLLVYGYSYGIRSSRKLDRECHYNVSFMWLTGGLKPDHKTISEFRKNNVEVLKRVLRDTARIGMKLGLIEGNILFVDGSKMRGNSSLDNSWTKEKAEEALKKVDAKIIDILKECDEVDKSEEGSPSLVKLRDDLQDKEKLKSKVEEILNELKSSNKKSYNTTDPESVKLRGVHGSFAGYNVQSVVDEKHGLIVSVDATSESNDYNQLTPQLEEAHEVLDKKCEVVCADTGYASIDDLVKVDESGIKVIVPSARQTTAEKKEPLKYAHVNFKYDPTNDCYTCPEGQKLTKMSVNSIRKRIAYRADKTACGACQFLSQCTSSKEGRMIQRPFDQHIKERLEAQYLKPENQAIYKLRKQKVELPFAHIKANLKLDTFLLRGKKKVKAEISILAACYNITRMINLIGLNKFKERIRAFAT